MLTHTHVKATASPALHYHVSVLNTCTHLFAIRLTIEHPAARQRLSLPVWIPGSYLVREFAQNLQNLQASQDGDPIPLQQVNKNTWQTNADPTKPLILQYEVYAFDRSVRTAFLDTTRGFFNATSLCLRVNGKDDQPHALTIEPGQAPVGWQVATSLRPQHIDLAGYGQYIAGDYDELADCPVELGRFWSSAFVAGGIPHRFVVSGAGAWVDFDRLLADTQRICSAQIRFWHGDQKPPFEQYLFILHASADGYGGLEHRNSTALICPRTDLPKIIAKDERPTALKATDGYTTLLGLISHEYFHTWNIKRLRPAEFENYNYDAENYTELLWFFEGFTSYYDDLFLRRAGLIDDACYLQLIAKNINQVQQTPGRLLQSVAQASFEAWTKFYRVHENTPNATVSYYTKGALVALCLDLTLRSEGSSLDEVMRELWRRSGGGPLREVDIARALKCSGARAYDTELRDWVHGVGELPVLQLLKQHGVQVFHDQAPLAQQLGLRVSESGSLVIKNVLRGGAAETAGMAAGDEWIGVEFASTRRGAVAEAWRVTKLDEVARLCGARSRITALVSRDKRLLRCLLTWPKPVQTIRLNVGEVSWVARWLETHRHSER